MLNSHDKSNSLPEYYDIEDMVQQRSPTCIETRDLGQSNTSRDDPPGVPAQVLTRVNHALASSRLDPFEMFPVQLTSQYHKFTPSL
jgi:hypothetical protein